MPRPLLILGCVVLLVLATVAIRSWRSRRQGLPQLAIAGRTEGIPALEEGNFDKANQLLSAAREAVDALGGEVDEADKIRHAADEAALFVNLLSDPLEGLLDEASRTSPQAWASRFESLYKGRSVIIDATHHRDARDGVDPSLRARLPGADCRRGDQGPAPGSDRFDRIRGDHHGRAKGGRPRALRRRLAAFEYDLNAGEWLIRFEPKSGVSLKYMKALETLGWPSGS